MTPIIIGCAIVSIVFGYLFLVLPWQDRSKLTMAGPVVQQPRAETPRAQPAQETKKTDAKPSPTH